MITADRRWLKFIVSGCGSIEAVQMTCDEQTCTREVESSTRLDEPKRLKPADDRLWTDPAGAASGQVAELKPAALEGGRVSNINLPAHRPTLPKEINRAGIAVWGLYKVCVNSAGDVESVSVIRSALPGGMDAHWISRIETWKYAPYVVDGKAMPFCKPARLEVRSVR
jgi:hypothetical protein